MQYEFIPGGTCVPFLSLWSQHLYCMESLHLSGTLLYSFCAETPWKGHCALLSLKKHTRRCLCICGRSVSKHGWEETVKMPWCTDHFLCSSSSFAFIVIEYFLVHHSFLISHNVVLTLCTPEGAVAGMQLQGCDRGVNDFKDCVSLCWVLWIPEIFQTSVWMVVQGVRLDKAPRYCGLKWAYFRGSWW